MTKNNCDVCFKRGNTTPYQIAQSKQPISVCDDCRSKLIANEITTRELLAKVLLRGAVSYTTTANGILRPKWHEVVYGGRTRKDTWQYG